MDNEKTIVTHAEKLGSTTDHFESPNSSSDDVLRGFQTDLDDLPAGYYRSSFFLGTMFAVGIGLTAAVGGFGLAAPALGLINSEIGPDPNINWVSFVYTLTLSISLLLVGRMSDLFGYSVSSCTLLIGLTHSQSKMVSHLWYRLCGHRFHRFSCCSERADSDRWYRPHWPWCRCPTIILVRLQ